MQCKIVRVIILTLFLIAGLPGVNLAAVHIGEYKKSSYDFYGHLFLQAGETIWADQFYEPDSYSGKNHLWSPTTGLRLGLRSTFSDRLQLDFAIDGILRFDIYSPPYVYRGNTPNGFTRQLKLFNATASYLTGSPQNVSLGIETGFFHFRCNPEIKNLGEYLMQNNASYY